jgi:hypothetical protein
MLIIYSVPVYWLLLRFYDPDDPALDAVYERYIMTGLTFLISGLLRPVLPGLRRIL